MQHAMCWNRHSASQRSNRRSEQRRELHDTRCVLHLLLIVWPGITNTEDETAQMLSAIVILAVAGFLYQKVGADKISRILPDVTREEVMQLTSGRYSSLFQSLSRDARDQVVEVVTLAIRNGFRPTLTILDLPFADENLAQEVLCVKVSRLFGTTY